MKKIVLDANIIVDFTDSLSSDHSFAKDSIRIIRLHFGKPVVSPITFIIADSLLGTFVRNKKWHKKQMELTLSEFEITPVLPTIY
jgi:predicted nucleic acid-binding protein